MNQLDTRDTSTIGEILGGLVERHAKVRLKDQKPVIPSYYQPEAVRQLQAALEQAGYRIARVTA